MNEYINKNYHKCLENDPVIFSMQQVAIEYVTYRYKKR